MSLTDIYQLTKLPRVSTDLASMVQITSDSDSEFLKLGVSGSSISKYILKPSPRLIWSKSVPPGFSVQCIESYSVKREVQEPARGEEQEEVTDEDKMDVDSEEPIEEEETQEEAGDNKDAEQEEKIEEFDEYFVFGAFDKSKKRHILQTLKVLPNDSELVQELKSNSKIVSIRVQQEYNSLIVITEEEIKSLDLTTYETNWVFKTLYVAEYVKYLAQDIILVIERSQSRSRSNKITKLNYRLVNSQGTEVNSKIIEHSGSNDLRFKFDVVEGVLYQYAIETNDVTTYQLPHFTQLKNINLSRFNIKQGDVVGINSPAKDRILITTANGIHLINIRFEISLAFIPSTKNIHSILSIEKPLRNNAGVINQTYQNFITISRGNEIAALAYTLDSNTIRDSLAKQQENTQQEINEVPSILNISSEKSPMAEILDSSLSPFDFDKKLFTYLEASQGYYTESDRIVSSGFITRCVGFIFETYKDSELPERVLTYLLTHPLFPQLEGSLLSKLRSSPRLLRQAIVTSNISLVELISELNVTDNAEIFKDLVTRILEFPKDKLDFKDLQTQTIIGKIIELDFGFELVSLLIDSYGILMWKEEEYVDDLIKMVENKINTLQGNQQVLSVLEAMESKNGLSAVKKTAPLYSVETLSFN